jgi:hypothetical protein
MRDKYNINIKQGLTCANIVMVVTFTLILVSFSVDVLRRTTSLETTRLFTIFYRLLLN